jgi:4-diphosphocytidyl-2-C-methyl-D-erythritol kinase
MLDRRFRLVTDRRVEGVAPAKLNLFLEVLRRREDGYHELATVFHEVDLCDRVAVELAPAAARDSIELAGIAIDGPPASNLALRAAASFRSRVPHCPPVRVELMKIVPPGSGMGGGSADAAFVLSAMQGLLGEPLSPSDLHSVARELGADVPFFLRGGTAMGRGRGDELTPVPMSRTHCFLIAFPSFSLSTSRVYEHVDLIAERADVLSFLQVVGEPGGKSPIEGCFNRLESAAGAVDPRAGELLARLRAQSRAAWTMTGSGSAIFTCVSDPQAAARIAEGVTGGGALDLRIVRSFSRERSAT